jgi:GT2 family glycosyltransferase
MSESPLAASGDRAGKLGVVVIGRNEGERLVRCLGSISSRAAAVVYVDSGSSDGSADRARAGGAEVVELDASLPFTAARGRNAGFEALAALHPDLACVQFVDGDCEFAPGWLEAAAEFLAAHPDIGVVFGRRRERHPDASVWNRLIDIEWEGPPGDSDACGGDALMRGDVVRRAGGYDATLIAGEDPEFCLRIRRIGARIVRLDREMTLHDAALLRFEQWWKRQARAGHAYAETVWRHREEPDPQRRRRLLSILFYGGAVPGASVLLLPPTAGASLLLLLTWALPWRGVYRETRKRHTPGDAARYATACVIGKLAEFHGALTFAWNHAIRRRATALIEYKGPRREDPGPPDARRP